MVDVSIIVPIYNVEKFLSRCLDSLINQTASSYEIICVNDKSPDECSLILDEYSKKYPEKIRVVENNKNLGLGLTRNEGMKIARGKYIMFVDSDDYVKDDYIQTYLLEMKQNPADIIIGGYIRETPHKQRAHFPSNSVWSLVTYAIACAKMFKSSFLKDNQLLFSDLKCGEDILFSLNAFCCEPSYRVINYAGYYYVFNKSSITGSMNYERNHEVIMSDLFDRFRAKHDTKKLSINKRQVIEYVYLANMINALIVFGHGCGVSRMKKKYSFVEGDIIRQFPELVNNPYLGFTKPKGQTLKIRLGIGVVYHLCRLRLSKYFFYLVSMV